VPTAEVAVHLADMCALDLPIFRAVHMALKGSIDFRDITTALMTRPLRSEKD
jgi:glycerol-3-phosphate dehydrogenase